jgi:hypothetical protein
MKIVASALHGAKANDHACLAHPGEEMLRCTSPGPFPTSTSWPGDPTGQEIWVCTTSFGLDLRSVRRIAGHPPGLAKSTRSLRSAGVLVAMMTAPRFMMASIDSQSSTWSSSLTMTASSRPTPRPANQTAT